MMKLLQSVLMLVSLFLPIAADATDNLILQENLNITNGLAHNGVTCMLRDSKGYLWIGTFDGLNCYNGYHLRTYKNTQRYKYFKSNRIRSIVEDGRRRLWIGTDDGVSIFDYENGHYLDLKPAVRGVDKSIMTSLCLLYDEKSSHVLAFTEKQGVFIYDMDGKLVSHLIIPGFTFANAVSLDSDNYLLAGDGGLLLLDVKRRVTYRVLAGNIKSARALGTVGVSSVVVGEGIGASKISYKKKGDRYVFSYGGKIINDKSYVSIKSDNAGGVWFGSIYDGCSRFPSLADCGSSADLFFPLGRISGFLFEGDNYWVYTFDNGVYHYRSSTNLFKTRADLHLLKPDIIEYDNSRVLIKPFINSSVCYLLNVATGQRTELSDDREIVGKVRRILFKSERLFCYLNTDNKLVYEKNGHVSAIDFAKLGEGENRDFFDAAEDKYGHLWVGFSSSLYCISCDKEGNISGVQSINDNPVFAHSKMNNVRCLYPDPAKPVLWVGTKSQGLYQVAVSPNISLRNCEVKHYYHIDKDTTSLSSNFVTSVLRMPDNDLWVGTEQGGVCKVLENNGKLIFKEYSEDDGLSNNAVKNLVPDKKGRLWISTNIGLNCYDKKRNRFLVFHTQDGLPFEDFDYSYAALKNGLLVFSSSQGLMYFNPDDVLRKESVPQIYFSSLLINGQQVRVEEEYNGRVVLKKCINDGDELSLRYDENNFSLNVDALYQFQSSNHVIAYYLEGSGAKWMYIPASYQTISFNGLQPGHYKLHVKASNSLGDWSKEKIVYIDINPPLWKTGWAYLLYFLIVAFAVFMSIRVLMRIQRLRHKVDMNEADMRHLEEMNSEKQRFFSNIAHELKTPLTLVFTSLSVLSDKFKMDVSVSSNLGVINKQAKKLLQLIDLVHDVEKSDKGLTVLNVSNLCFNDLVSDIVSDFSFMAKCDEKHLVVNNHGKRVFVKADALMLERIISNMLTNAFKHTKKGDEILISYDVEPNGSVLELKIKDTGCGISKQDIQHIFERYYQGKSEYDGHVGGTGIGLTFCKRMVEIHNGTIRVESEVGKGAEFLVEMPIVVSFDNDVNDKVEVTDDVDRQQLIMGGAHMSEVEVNPELKNSMIFIVEDNPEVRTLLVSFIDKYYQVEAYANGQECLDVMEHKWPDLVVSDVMMPVVDGVELCNRIKTDIKTSHIPVILLTACSTIDEKIAGLKTGADAYINKPFYPEYLMTRIEMLLLNRKSLRERFQIEIPLTFGDQKNVSAKNNEFMERLYELFSEHLSDEEVDVNFFATELGVSRTLFFQKIKSLTNESPYELWKQFRLKKAAQMLEKGDVNVNEVYFMTGFKSRTHFGRLFKEVYGVSPGKYAKNVNNGDDGKNGGSDDKED